MKRFLTILFAIAFSGVALSAQNNADTLVIVVKERQSIDQQAKKEQRLPNKDQKIDRSDI